MSSTYSASSLVSPEKTVSGSSVIALFWRNLELRKDVKLRKTFVSIKLTTLNFLFLFSVSGNIWTSSVL